TPPAPMRRSSRSRRWRPKASRPGRCASPRARTPTSSCAATAPRRSPLSATQVKLDAEIDRQHGRIAPGALAGWAEETIRRLAPQQEWDRWRVYAAQRLDLAPDDLRRARMMLNPLHFAPRGAA